MANSAAASVPQGTQKQGSPDRLTSTTLTARGGGCTAVAGGTDLGQPVPS